MMYGSEEDIFISLTFKATPSPTATEATQQSMGDKYHNPTDIHNMI